MARGVKNGAGAKKGAKRRAAADSDDEARVVKKAKSTTGIALGKKKVDPGIFQGLPLDLLREISQYLSPNDLVNLCDASLSFYNALCRNSETYLWKTLREKVEGIWEIPDGINEYYWAKLLFSNRCMECGAENVQFADFYLRRRICKACKKIKCIRRNWESESKFSELAFDCSPETHSSWNGSTSSLNRFYWTADIVEQDQKIKALELDLEMERPGALRALEEYKILRRQQVRVIRAAAPDFEAYQNRYHEKKKDLYGPRYEEIERRFLELGYLTRDFPSNIKMHKLVRLKTELTHPEWRGILEVLEPEIQKRRDRREDIEWVKLKASRRCILDEAYAAHKFKNVPHPLWRSLPQVHILCTLAPFASLITCDKERKLTREDFAVPLAQLDETVGAAYEDARARLRNCVIEAKDPFLSQLESTEAFQSLELATIVFRCNHCEFFIFGFDDIRTHRCADEDYALTPEQLTSSERPREPKRFSKEFPFDCTFQPGAAEVMCMIVETFGLDPKTATVAQMDAKALRLSCDCDSAWAYTWAEYFFHFNRAEWHLEQMKAGKVQKPQLIAKAYIPQIRALEEKDRRHSYVPFACAHCEEGGRARSMCRFDSMANRAQYKHSIQKAKIGVDLVDMGGRFSMTYWRIDILGVRYDKNLK